MVLSLLLHLPPTQVLPQLHTFKAFRALLATAPVIPELDEKLNHVALPFIDCLLNGTFTGVELLKWVFHRGILPKGLKRDDSDLHLDVQVLLETVRDYINDIPDAAYGESAVLLIVCYLLGHWPESITPFPCEFGGSLNFRDHGTRTLLVDGSAEFSLLNEDPSLEKPTCDTIKLGEVTTVLASFLDHQLHPLVMTILPILFAFVAEKLATHTRTGEAQRLPVRE